MTTYIDQQNDPQAPAQQDTPAQAQPAPQVQDKSTKPTGVIPANVRNVILIGVSALLIAVIWLSTRGNRDSNTSASPSQATVSSNAPVEDQNKAEQVSEVQGALRQEQAQQQAQSTAGPSPETGSAAPVSHLYNYKSPADTSTQTTGYGQAATEPDPIVEDMRKRAYMASFESNVALSYRDMTPPASLTGSGGNSNGPETQDASSEWAQLESLVSKLSPEQLLGLQFGNTPAPKPLTPPAPIKPEHSAVAGTQYTLFEGTMLSTALVNRLIGLAGPVTCMVTRDVYSLDGQHLLIPAGTKVLGNATPVNANTTSNLVLVFHRMILPNGTSVSLANSPTAQDPALETGGQKLRVLAGTIGIGAMAGFAQISPQSITADTAPYFFDYSWKVFQTSINAITKLFSFAPKVTVKEGHPVSIYLTRDLQLPEYRSPQFSENSSQLIPLAQPPGPRP